jgi:LmbE family N-acetylglucosaminyl deacetylase
MSQHPVIPHHPDMTVHPVHASSAPPAAIGAALPPATGVLAVCAHPDDESFGLGAILAALTDAGVPVAVLCFTHGEASTLHATPGELAAVRVDELTQAAAHLGVGRAELLAYPDGRLADQPLGELAQHVRRLADDVGADTLVVFDLGGITGHPDHQAATDAALAAAVDGRYSVLAWTLPDAVAQALNAEFGTAFVGRDDHNVDLVLPVERRRQLGAIHRHASQSTDNPVLWRRLHLQGDVEWLRWLRVDGLAPSRDPRRQ